EGPGRPLTTTLIDHLRARSLLLVLDNCEHLLAACAQFVEALLRACPNVRVMATSRERLGLTGERVYGVPSLSLPPAKGVGCWVSGLPTARVPGSEPSFPDTLLQSEAVRLFLERARSEEHTSELQSRFDLVCR